MALLLFFENKRSGLKKREKDTEIERGPFINGLEGLENVIFDLKSRECFKLPIFSMEFWRVSSYAWGNRAKRMYNLSKNVSLSLHIISQGKKNSFGLIFMYNRDICIRISTLAHSTYIKALEKKIKRPLENIKFLPLFPPLPYTGLFSLLNAG